MQTNTPAKTSSKITPNAFFKCLSTKLMGKGLTISKNLNNMKAIKYSKITSLQYIRAIDWPIYSSTIIELGSLSFFLLIDKVIKKYERIEKKKMKNNRVDKPNEDFINQTTGKITIEANVPGNLDI